MKIGEWVEEQRREIQRPATDGISDGSIIRQYIAFRDELEARAKKRQAEDAPLVEGMQLLEGAMAIRLRESQAESIKSEWGTVYQSRSLTVKTADKEALFNYIRDSDNFQLLAGNLSKDAVKDFLDEHQQAPPPGVDVAYITKTLFRRA